RAAGPWDRPLGATRIPRRRGGATSACHRPSSCSTTAPATALPRRLVAALMKAPATHTRSAARAAPAKAPAAPGVGATGFFVFRSSARPPLDDPDRARGGRWRRRPRRRHQEHQLPREGRRRKAAPPFLFSRSYPPRPADASPTLALPPRYDDRKPL